MVKDEWTKWGIRGSVSGAPASPLLASIYVALYFYVLRRWGIRKPTRENWTLCNRQLPAQADTYLGTGVE